MMGWTFLDALYQVVITISGVGFDEVRPMVSTVLANLHDVGDRAGDALGRVHAGVVRAIPDRERDPRLFWVATA